MTGLAELDAMIAAAKASYGLAPADVARAAVPFVDAAVKATAAAGTTPDGKPWAPTKGGGRALENAASALSTSSSGSVVTVTLSGPEVFHNAGGRVPKRQILPDGGAGVPKNVAEALTKAAAQGFTRATGGG